MSNGHDGGNGNGDGTPMKTAPDIMNDVTLLLKDLTSPETQVKFNVSPRPDQATIRDNIGPSSNTSSTLELSTGASDADSYHDFYRLQIAFDDVWAEVTDTSLPLLARQSYVLWDQKTPADSSHPCAQARPFQCDRRIYRDNRAGE